MNRSAGFTLVELVITIGIMTIISGVVFFSFPRLNQAVLLNRAARELTLALRDAQNRAIAVAQLPGASAEFPKNYGIHVEKGTNNGVFFLFSDSNDGHSFDNSSYDECEQECVKRYEFTYNIKVLNIQVPTGSLAGDELDIMFYRPDPTMEVYGCANADNLCNGVGPYKITIYREGQDESDTRTIQVWTTGQISFSNP